MTYHCALLLLSPVFRVGSGAPVVRSMASAGYEMVGSVPDQPLPIVSLPAPDAAADESAIIGGSRHPVIRGSRHAVLRGYRHAVFRLSSILHDDYYVVTFKQFICKYVNGTD